MKSTKKERIGWYFYDWANSVFYTSVITVFLGPYLNSLTKSVANAQGNIFIFGIPIHYGAYFPYLISASVLLQVMFLPILGAIADNTKYKKTLLGVFAYLGSFATVLFYYIDKGNYHFGGILFIIANLSFGASMVMYNSFLNDISEPEDRDSISSIGWGIGYIGGGVFLAFNLLFYMNAEKLQIDSGLAVRICLSSAGIWWGMFTIIPMLLLKARDKSYIRIRATKLISVGYTQLKATIKDAKNYPNTLKFILAYILYNDGVQTVIAMSASFGQEELGLTITTLTTVILMVQFVAFFGSIIFNYIARKIGAKNSILIGLVIWVMVTIYAFAFLNTVIGFYLLSICIGLVLGGTQALSRSMYSTLIPSGKEAEYFSLYEISEKGTSWIGTFTFALALQFSGSYRFAVLSLALFFIIGIFMLLKVNYKKYDKVLNS